MSWVLKGPAKAFDKREWFAGPDVVELALAGEVGAVRYVEPLPLMAAVPKVMMRGQPSLDAEAVSELLFGEGFEIVDVKDGWALGRRLADRYIGWVPEAALVAPIAATHRITARRAPVFAAASIKAPIVFDLPFGAQVTGAVDGAFLVLAEGAGFVHQRHVAAGPADRFAAVQQFMGAPYRWGGRTPDGVDCSGLVQAALAAEGIALPRDSDQQAGCGLGVDYADRQAGDLVFFPGHVGVLLAGDQLCHANAHWMAVVAEPLADVVARAGGPAAVSAVRRLG
jgi:cell wall-associated NlpC family hydrolase